MNLINKEAITNDIVHDMELMVRCSNPEVFAFCNEHGWNIGTFLDLIEDEGITIVS